MPKEAPKENEEWKVRATPALDRLINLYLELRPKMGHEEFLNYVRNGMYGPHEEEQFVEDMAGLYGAEEAEKLRKLWRAWYEVEFASKAVPVTREDIRAQLEDRSSYQEITREQVAIFENSVREELLRNENKLFATMTMFDPYGNFVFVAETYTPVKDRASRPMAEIIKEAKCTGSLTLWEEEMKRLNRIARQEGKVRVWHVSIEKGRKWTVNFNYKHECYVVLEMEELEPQKYEITNEFLLREDLPPDYVKAFPKDMMEYARRSWPDD